MNFKEWLLLNEEKTGFKDWIDGWLSTKPSYLGDYSGNSLQPKYHWYMQYQIDRGRQSGGLGRPVHNVDVNEFANRKYTAVQSLVPPVGPGFWEHKPDDGKGYLKPIKNVDLHPIGIGPCADTCGRIIDNSQDTHGFKDTFPLHEPGDAEINRIFGDKAGKWPEISDALR